jgi:hypothetical protein
MPAFEDSLFGLTLPDLRPPRRACGYWRGCCPSRLEERERRQRVRRVRLRRGATDGYGI